MSLDRYRKILAMERNASASKGERDNARRIRLRMEKEDPTLFAQAELEEAQERAQRAEKDREDAWQRRTQAERQAREEQRRVWQGRVAGLGARVADFLQDAVDSVAHGLSVIDRVEEHADIEVEVNSRSMHIHLSMAVDDVLDVADDPTVSLEEYTRLVGIRVGQELLATLREAGY